MAFIRRYIPLLTQTFKNVYIDGQRQKIHRWVAPTLMELKRREDKQGGKVMNPRNTFLEWNLEAELFAFGKRLNEEFDSDLLLQAFTDRSYVIKEEMKQKEMEFNLKLKDNRELAEEGRKFMEQYIQLYLEAVLPKFPSEGLAGVFSHLNSEKVLANVALHLGTKDIILADEYPVDNSILANAFKAIVGALLRSSGEEHAAHFVRDFVITNLQGTALVVLREYLKKYRIAFVNFWEASHICTEFHQNRLCTWTQTGQDVNEFWHIEDPWTMLTDLIAKTGSKLEPRLIGEVGKNTLLACYRVGLYLDKKMLSSGFGETAATAKEMAAREALKKIFGTEENMYPINFKLNGMPKSSSNSRYQVSAS